jgi:DNA-binding response OmpR family regulator
MEPSPLAPGQPVARNRILVVDDEEAFRNVISGFLRKHDFEIMVAADGKDGIAIALTRVPDLIVCDLAMPGMGGYEMLAALRSEPKLADIPVIFLTGESEPEQVREGMNLGADDYLTKPVNFEDLLGAIRARLNRRQIERFRREKEMDRGLQVFAGIIHDLRDPLFAVSLALTGMNPSILTEVDPLNGKGVEMFPFQGG